MIKNIIASPHEIIIIEDLSRAVEDQEGTIKYYLQQYKNIKIIEKEIIIALNASNELVALDGNKLCFAARLAQRNVLCKFIECNEDYRDVQFLKKAEIRNSPLLINKELRDKYLLNQIEYKDYFEIGKKMRDACIDIPRAGLTLILDEIGITFCRECLIYKGISEATASFLGIRSKSSEINHIVLKE